MENRIGKTFKKEERLKSAKEISRLFDAGNAFLTFPIKVVWMETGDEQPFPAQAAFSVSRKTFRRAVDRNRIKRKMREAYRNHKHILYGRMQKNIRCMFIFIAKEELPYATIEKSMKTIAAKLIKLTAAMPD